MKLSEDMVVARSRGAELDTIKKLNCWGSEINDVTVVRNMPNVEILALSVNNISTLADFQFCKNLSELYIRKNKIQDLNEVVYLKELPRLKSLWLADNPCAERDRYRLTVLRSLPHLQKLDNTDVESDEVQKAMTYGDDLIHPAEAAEMAVRQRRNRFGGYEPVSDSVDLYRPCYNQQRQQQQYADRVAPSSGGARTSSTRSVSPHYYQQSHPQQQQTPASSTYYRGETRDSTGQYSHYDVQSPAASTPSASRRTSYTADTGGATYSEQRYSTGAAYTDDIYSGNTAESTSCPVHRSQQQRTSQGSVQQRGETTSTLYREDSQQARYVGTPNTASYDRSYPTVDDDGYRSSDVPHRVVNVSSGDLYSSESGSTVRHGSAGRPRKRSSNILSAVLCLIKELDTHGLEVVETAARCRIHELQD